MKKQQLATLLLTSTLLFSCAGSREEEEGSVYPEPEITLPTAYCGKSANKPIYQILVYSFADSDGDKIGDFQGIIDHLDYLASLNVGTLWLSPIHPSDTYHHYDVKDYFAVDPIYGGMEGLEKLIEAAKAKGIGIMLDMVFNHASKASSLFQTSLERYRTCIINGTIEQELEDENSVVNDFVISTDPKKAGLTHYSDTKDGVTLYYEANFDSNMPEFNLDSKRIRAYQKSIMDFYLAKGVSGFRFDGVKYFYLDQREKSREYAKYLADSVRDSKEDAVMVGEFWDSLAQSSYDSFITSMPIFNFPTSDMGSGSKGSPSYSMRSGDSHLFSTKLFSVQSSALNASEGKVQPVYFLQNHDTDRETFSELNKAKLAAAAYLLTPGTPTIYYGEEIQLKGKRTSTQSTDASRRLPMQWKANGDEYRCRTFDGVSEPADQVKVGALEEIEKEGTLASYYKKVLKFRADHKELRDGIYASSGNSLEALSMTRVVLDGETKGYLYHNFDYDSHTTWMAPEGARMDNSLSLGNDSYSGHRLTVSPYSTVYLEVTNS